MRRLLIAVAILCSGPAEASRWTLDALVKKLQVDAPNVIAARHAVEAAQDGLRAAQFAWLPTGDATLFMTGSPDVKCLPLHDDANPASDQVNPDQAVRERNCLRTTVVSLNSAGTSLYDIAPIHGLFLRLDINLNQQLYAFGRTEAAIAAAQSSLDTAKANLEAAQADTLWYASRAYWGLKASRAAVESIDEAIEKLKEWVDKIDEQLNGKNTSKYTEVDLARMKIALTYANTQLYDQQRNLAYAKEALEFLAGEKDADVDEGELDLLDDDVSLPEWQSRGLRLRPEIHLLHANDAYARSQRKARLADMLPSLSFGMSLNYGFASAMDTPQNYYFNRPNFLNVTMGLSLSMGLDFGPKTMRLYQARHDEQATIARSRGSQATYSTEIAKAYEDYQEARARAKEFARGEKISRGWYFAIDSNVQAGLSESREMVEALQSYFSFRLRGFQAVYEANTALDWLKRTTVGASKY